MAKYTFTESFNVDACKKLLSNKDIGDDNKKKLSALYKRRVKGNQIKVDYDYNKYWDDKGRLYAQTPSLQMMERDIRSALVKDIDIDIDMVNAHCSILNDYCDKNKLINDEIKIYCENRDNILSNIVSTLSVEHKEAKKLYIRMLFGGHPNGWFDDNLFSNYKDNVIYKNALKFYYELREIQDYVYENEKEYLPLLKRKQLKNPYDIYTYKNEKGRVLSFFLQDVESKILDVMIKFFLTKGFVIKVLMFDGLHIEKTDRFNEDVLSDCEEYIKNETGYNIKLLEKPIETTFELDDFKDGFVDENIIVDDYYAAKTFVNLLEDNIVLSNNTVMVYDFETGMWSDSLISIKKWVTKYSTKLLFRQYNNKREIIHNYSGDHSKVNKMIENLPQFIPINQQYSNFVEEKIKTKFGKFLFLNGYLDLLEGKFTKGFTKDIVFRTKISRNFPEVRDDNVKSNIQLLKELVWDKIFYKNKDAEYFYKQYIASGMLGEYFLKILLFCLGDNDNGKSLLQKLHELAFGDNCDAFNANNLCCKGVTSKDPELALMWTHKKWDKMILYGNEPTMDDNVKFDGTLIKTLASGGDNMETRVILKEASKHKFYPRIIINANDISNFNVYDRALHNRLFFIDFKSTFCENPEGEYQFKLDEHLLHKLQTDDILNAFIYDYMDFIQIYKKNGFIIPECVKRSKENWQQGETDIRKLIEYEYVITANVNDYEPTEDILKHLNKNNVRMTSNKLTSYIKKNIPEITPGINKRIEGKVQKCCVGIRVWCDKLDSENGYECKIDEKYDEFVESKKMLSVLHCNTLDKNVEICDVDMLSNYIKEYEKNEKLNKPLKANKLYTKTHCDMNLKDYTCHYELIGNYAYPLLYDNTPFSWKVKCEYLKEQIKDINCNQNVNIFDLMDRV